MFKVLVCLRLMRKNCIKKNMFQLFQQENTVKRVELKTRETMLIVEELEGIKIGKALLTIAINQKKTKDVH